MKVCGVKTDDGEDAGSFFPLAAVNVPSLLLAGYTLSSLLSGNVSSLLASENGVSRLSQTPRVFLGLVSGITVDFTALDKRYQAANLSKNGPLLMNVGKVVDFSNGFSASGVLTFSRVAPFHPSML